MIFTRTNPKEEVQGFSGYNTIVSKAGENCTEKDRKA
jgi:hypothetical protein